MGANRMPASCFLNPNIFIINSHIPITALVQLQFPIGRGGHSVRYKQNFGGIQTVKPLNMNH